MQRKGVIGMPVPGGRLPRRTAIDGKWLIASSARPFPHVQGNRMQGSGGATPARGELCSSWDLLFASRSWGLWKIEESPAGGPAAPRPPRHFHPSFFIHQMLCPTVLSCPGQSCAGVRGCNPRAEANFAVHEITSLRIEIMRALENRRVPCRGACCPPVPPPIANGAGTGKHATWPSIMFYRQMLRPPPPRISRGNRVQESGGATPGQMLALCERTENQAKACREPAAPRSPRRLRLRGDGPGQIWIPAPAFRRSAGRTWSSCD